MHEFEPGPSWARPNWPLAELDPVNAGLDPTEALIVQPIAEKAKAVAQAAGADPDAVRRAADDTQYGTPEVALTNAGNCARDAGDLAAAEENFRAALMRNPRYADALLNMLELTYQAGEHLQARAFIQRYLDVRPATAPVLLTCVNVERALNNGAAADRCAARLRSGFPGSPEVAQLEEQQRRDGR